VKWRTFMRAEPSSTKYNESQTARSVVRVEPAGMVSIVASRISRLNWPRVS